MTHAAPGPADFPAGRWRARWIWSHAPAMAARGPFPAPSVERNPSWACLRARFALEAVPVRVPARCTADSRYVLFVNGRELARGPIRCNPRRLHLDEMDLAPALRPGDNVVAVLARHFAQPNPWWAPAPPAFQLGAGSFVFEARLGADVWWCSDGRWRALAGDAWEELPAGGLGGMPYECVDARALPAGWTEPGFDDSGWGAAVELAANSIGFTGRHEPPSHPYGALRSRPIALLGCTPREGRVARVAHGDGGLEPASPFAQVIRDAECSAAGNAGALPLALPATRGGAHVVSVDFGEVVAGTVALELEAPAGARVDAAAVEFLDAEGVPRPDEERAGFRYVARGHADAYETLTPFGLRGLVLSLRSAAPVTLRRVAVNERLHPRPTGPFFECSDPLLDRVWAVGRRSVDLCSHDAYLDCPTREQRGWTGDFVVHQMVDFATNPDWRLARWNVELCASPRPDGMLPMAAGGDVEHADPVFIPDWALHWIRALHNLWRYTGDRETVARLLPVAEGVLAWLEPFEAEDGLATDVTGWVIIDWSSVHVDGKSSVLNALWARALRDLAEMAEWLGDAGRARRARDRHARLARAFELFWDPERELYVDHARGAERCRPVSQHAQAAPLAAGLVPPERVARVLDVMLDEERLVHAAWSVARGDARFPGPGEGGVGGVHLGLGPPAPWWDVEREIVRAQPFFRYVVHDAVTAAGRSDRIPRLCRDWEALLARCGTSWSETWYGGTVSHAWGATPTRDLSTRTLGVTPAVPGFSRARVAPRPGDLAWVRGAVPTPWGSLAVDVDTERVEVESPVPFELDLGDGRRSEHPPGRHRARRG